MEVNEALIDHIAHLSKLSFVGAQKDAIRQDIHTYVLRPNSTTHTIYYVLTL